jgi:hypothetical protein
MAERNMVIIVGLVVLRGEKRCCGNGNGSGGSELCLPKPTRWVEYNREGAWTRRAVERPRDDVGVMSCMHSIECLLPSDPSSFTLTIHVLPTNSSPCLKILTTIILMMTYFLTLSGEYLSA